MSVPPVLAICNGLWRGLSFGGPVLTPGLVLDVFLGCGALGFGAPVAGTALSALGALRASATGLAILGTNGSAEMSSKTTLARRPR